MMMHERREAWQRELLQREIAPVVITCAFCGRRSQITQGSAEDQRRRTGQVSCASCVRAQENHARREAEERRAVLELAQELYQSRLGGIDWDALWRLPDAEDAVFEADRRLQRECWAEVCGLLSIDLPFRPWGTGDN